MGVIRFYPDDSKDLTIFLASLSASTLALEQRLSAPSTLKRCVTASVPLPSVGQNAREQFRLCNGFYTRIF